MEKKVFWFLKRSSISRNGSEDLDPDQNETDPKHCRENWIIISGYFIKFFLWVYAGFSSEQVICII